MRRGGFASADEVVRVALETLGQVRGVDFEDLDAETRAAIEEGLAQADRGEGRPLDEVRAELRARFGSLIRNEPRALHAWDE
jgi:Arc/MetJ-type ribon-helix-helix transcriptional regulator